MIPNPTEFPIGQQQHAVKQAIAQQVGKLGMSIYAQAVAGRLQHPGPMPCDFGQLALQCQTAAKAYFQGLGVQFEETPTDAT